MLKNRIELAKHFNELGFKTGAEIGVAKGRYSEILCQEIPGLALACVDPWTAYKGNRRGGGNSTHTGNYEIAKERLSKYNKTFIRKFSTEALREIANNSLDFVFIDGNHDYDFVMEDIIGWSRKVRSGGIISGHDHYQFHNSGVIEAVADYTRFHNIKFELTEWDKTGDRDDQAPCFYWTKP